MITPVEFYLALALVFIVGLLVGGVQMVLWVERGSRRIDKQVERSGVWRIEDRAYRLVRSPGLDDVKP